MQTSTDILGTLSNVNRVPHARFYSILLSTHALHINTPMYMRAFVFTRISISRVFVLRVCRARAQSLCGDR